MSRIGKKPIAIPDGVEVTVNGSHISVKGPKGTLERDLNSNVTVKVEDKEVKVEIPSEEYGNLHGLKQYDWRCNKRIYKSTWN